MHSTTGNIFICTLHLCMVHVHVRMWISSPTQYMYSSRTNPNIDHLLLPLHSLSCSTTARQCAVPYRQERVYSHTLSWLSNNQIVCPYNISWSSLCSLLCYLVLLIPVLSPPQQSLKAIGEVCWHYCTSSGPSEQEGNVQAQCIWSPVPVWHELQLLYMCSMS